MSVGMFCARPQQDYVMYLDDDSFLNIPRLIDYLQWQQSDSLAMGDFGCKGCGECW